jgi:hypothetical protein
MPISATMPMRVGMTQVREEFAALGPVLGVHTHASRVDRGSNTPRGSVLSED